VRYAQNPLTNWSTICRPGYQPQNGIIMATDLTAREISMSHTIDDIETKRAHMNGMLASQRWLLATALAAIRNGDTHVADEYVDRFLTHVDAELAYQRGAY
jgi:hypothetical protein